MIGRQIGVYRVVSLIGAGGMGEVYRAHDTKLGRDVALKVLPASFAADEGRAARLGREARTLAALNHPRIATIHGYEDPMASAPSSWNSWTGRRWPSGSRPRRPRDRCVSPRRS